MKKYAQLAFTITSMMSSQLLWGSGNRRTGFVDSQIVPSSFSVASSDSQIVVDLQVGEAQDTTNELVDASNYLLDDDAFNLCLQHLDKISGQAESSVISVQEEASLATRIVTILPKESVNPLNQFMPFLRPWWVYDVVIGSMDDTLKEVPEDTLNNPIFIKTCKDFMVFMRAYGGCVRMFDILSMIQAVSMPTKEGVDKSYFFNVCKKVANMVTGTRDGSTIVCIIKMVAEMPEDWLNNKKFLAVCDQFIRKLRYGVHEQDVNRIIQNIAEMLAEKLNDQNFLDVFYWLTSKVSNVGEQDVNRIIQNIDEILEMQMNDQIFFDTFSWLVSKVYYVGVLDVATIITILSTMREKRLNNRNFFDACDQFIRKIYDKSVANVSTLILILSAIPAERSTNKNFINICIRFLKLQYNQLYRLPVSPMRDIVHAFAETPEALLNNRNFINNCYNKFVLMYCLSPEHLPPPPVFSPYTFQQCVILPHLLQPYILPLYKLSQIVQEEIRKFQSLV